MFEPYILYLISKKSTSEKKQGLKFLRLVYGIGFLRAYKFLNYYGPNKNYNVKVTLLSPKFFKRMQGLAFRLGFPLGAYLKRKQDKVRIFMLKIQIRRGLRRAYGLPSRGQRSHSNASTCQKKLKVKSLKENSKKKKKRY